MLKDTTLFVEITKEDVSTIFSNMDVIAATHTTFLELLEDCVQQWPTKKTNIASVFMEVVNSSPHYMHYISTLSDALTTVHNASLKAKFPNFLKVLQSNWWHY